MTLAGCAGITTDGSGPATENQPAATDEPTDDTPTPSNSCVPDDVTRPTVPSDTTLGGRSYPDAPADVTAESVARFLADFEGAFAWNRAVETREDLTNVRVDTLAEFVPEAVGDGFLASSAMRLLTATEQDDGRTRTERDDYVVNYYVGEEVYRVETADRRVDPRDSPDRQLVACGTDTGT